MSDDEVPRCSCGRNPMFNPYIEMQTVSGKHSVNGCVTGQQTAGYPGDPSDRWPFPTRDGVLRQARERIQGLPRVSTIAPPGMNEPRPRSALVQHLDMLINQAEMYGYQLTQEQMLEAFKLMRDEIHSLQTLRDKYAERH